MGDKQQEFSLAVLDYEDMARKCSEAPNLLRSSYYYRKLVRP